MPPEADVIARDLIQDLHERLGSAATRLAQEEERLGKLKTVPMADAEAVKRLSDLLDLVRRQLRPIDQWKKANLPAP